MARSLERLNTLAMARRKKRGLRQHETPPGFQTRWRVGGAPWETSYAQQVGTDLGYVSGNRIALRMDDGSVQEFSPWELFPYRPDSE